VTHGHVGYLRETYDGEPYATQILVPEAFQHEAEVPAARLRAPLDEVLRTAMKRQVQVYACDVVDFVELCERKEFETA